MLKMMNSYWDNIAQQQTHSEEEEPPQSMGLSRHDAAPDSTHTDLHIQKNRDNDHSDDSRAVTIPQHSSYNGQNGSNGEKPSWLKRLFVKKNDDNRLRETIEELIEEDDAPTQDDQTSMAVHEKALLANILKLRDQTVFDVMVPRADIVAVDKNIGREDLLNIFADNPRSRLPVYRDNLDNIIGTVHIKDVLAMIADNRNYDLSAIIREVKIISPAVPVLDLLLDMRMTRNHMAMVVDEYGGIDGLVTLGDLMEAIIGEIDDEHDDADQPHMRQIDKNIIIADARLDIEEFERFIGVSLLDDDEREDIDTLAGFLFSFAGRVPVRGELIKHPFGLEFEVLDGDGRRIRKIKIRINPQMLANAVQENN